MRWAIASIIFAGIAAAGMFAALSAASRYSQPAPSMPGGMTVVYPTVRPVVIEAPAHPSYVARDEDTERAGWSRRIRCAGLVDTCFYKGPMAGTESRK